MKKVLAAIVAVALVFVSASYLLGQRAESVVKGQFAKAEAQYPGLVVTLKSESRRVFSSRYVYLLDMTVPQEQPSAKPVRVAVDATVDVAHGPLPLAGASAAPCLAQITGAFAVAPESDPAIKDFFANFPELLASTATTRIFFSMDGASTLTVPPLSRTITTREGKPLSVSWQGLNASATHDAEFTTFVNAASAPLLLVKDAEATLALRDMTLASNARLLTGMVWGGDHKVKVGAIEFTSAGAAKPDSVSGLSLDVSLTPRGDIADYTVAAEGRLNSSSGASLPLRAKMALRNLDIAALNEFLTLARKSGPGASARTLDEAQLRSIGNAMLPRSPSFGIELGAFEGEGAVSLSADLSVEGLASIPETAEQAVPFLRGKARLAGGMANLSQAVCRVVASNPQSGVNEEQCRRELPMAAAQYAAMGLLTINGDKVESSATWDGKALMVNGRPLN